MTLIREITEKMINKALEDSKMTKDEYEQIKKVQLDYSIYSNELEKAMGDGTITDGERVILDLIKEHIGFSEKITNENELIKKIEDKLE